MFQDYKKAKSVSRSVSSLINTPMSLLTGTAAGPILGNLSYILTGFNILIAPLMTLGNVNCQENIKIQPKQTLEQISEINITEEFLKNLKKLLTENSEEPKSLKPEEIKKIKDFVEKNRQASLQPT